MPKKTVTITWETTQEVDISDDSLQAEDLVGFEFLQNVEPEHATIVSAHITA